MANVVSFGVVPGTYLAAVGIESNSREVEYVATFDMPVDDAEEVLALPGVPFPGYQLANNTSLYCTNVSVAPEPNNHRVWRIRAQFDASGIAVKEGLAYDFKPGTNPIAKAARGAYWYSKDTDKPSGIHEKPDIPVENTAGDPFAEPITVVQNNRVLTWWQVETVAVSRKILDGTIYEFLGTVNLDEVLICNNTLSAGSALLKNLEPELYQYRAPNSTNSELRFRTRYTVEISENGSWVDSILDQGYNAFLRKTQTDSTLVKRPIRLSDLPYNTDGNKIKKNDAEDDYINTAIKLDGTGKILADDADPVYLNYLVKKMISWRGLDLAKYIATPQNVIASGQISGSLVV